MKEQVTITGENLNVVVNGAAAARKKSKAELRIEALKAKGIDTSCYYPIAEDYVIKLESGKVTLVDTPDETEKKIAEGGYINHYTLFRRWVMSQMFRMLRNGKDISTQIRWNGYEYQWKVVENEMRAQYKMFKNGDTENYRRRNRWFNSDVIEDMIKDYKFELANHITKHLMYDDDKKGTFKHTCKGIPYVRICGENIFVNDLNKKLYHPILMFVQDVHNSKTPKELYDTVVKFNRFRKKLRRYARMDDRFIDRFKGAGAYFTCRNLIMFHEARFLKFGETLGIEASLRYLEERAEEYSLDGWRMIGVMKQLIKDSGISVQAKIDEWEK